MIRLGFAEQRGKGKNAYFRGRYKRPDGTYGTLPEKFATRTDAKKAANAEEAKQGIASVAYSDPREAKTTFGAWAEQWMTAKRKQPRTMERRWFLLEKLLLPHWEFTELGAITWFDVESWADASDYDRSTVRDAITLLGMILTGAVDKKKIGVNPVAGRRWKPSAREPDAPVNRKGKKTGGKNKVVPTAEQALLISQRCRNDTERLMILTAMWVGLRYGELCALHRDNCLIEVVDRINGKPVPRYVIRIDPQVGELKEYGEHVARGKTKTVIKLGPPKSSSSVRDVDVPPFLVDLLRSYMDEWPHPYLFTTPSGKWWRRSNWATQVMRPIADGRDGPATAPWVLISRDLEQQIRSGRLRPGSELPTLASMAKQHKVAASTVHRAVRRLADKGLVVCARGERTRVVRELPTGGVETVVDLESPILPGLELHGFRHANDTRQEQGDAMGSIPETLRKESLGHAHKGMDGVYLHATPEMRQRRLALLEQWYWDAHRVVFGESGKGPGSPEEQREPVSLPKISHRVTVRGGRTLRRRSAA